MRRLIVAALLLAPLAALGLLALWALRRALPHDGFDRLPNVEPPVEEYGELAAYETLSWDGRVTARVMSGDHNVAIDIRDARRPSMYAAIVLSPAGARRISDRLLLAAAYSEEVRR